MGLEASVLFPILILVFFSASLHNYDVRKEGPSWSNARELHDRLQQHQHASFSALREERTWHPKVDRPRNWLLHVRLIIITIIKSLFINSSQANNIHVITISFFINSAIGFSSYI